MESLQWEQVIFADPTLTVKGNYLYFNAVMRDILDGAEGVDFFKSKNDKEMMLSLKAGKNFRFAPKKGEKRVICKGLSDYIIATYNGNHRFKLLLSDGFYILEPMGKKINKARLN